MNKPLITVVSVCYNAEKDIEKTIRSALSQTLQNIEFVIIDGKSTDNTLGIITSLRNEFPNRLIKIKSEEDKGIYDAMNKAINMATGEWIFFLNSGDIFSYNHILENIFKHELKDYSAIYTDVINSYNGKHVYKEAKRPFFAKSHEYLNMGFGHQSVIVKTHLAKKMMFDTSFKCCADFMMIKKIYDEEGKFLYIPLPICITENSYGFSNNNQELQVKELAKINGVENTIKFKAFLFWMNTKKRIKQYIKYRQ